MRMPNRAASPSIARPSRGRTALSRRLLVALGLAGLLLAPTGSVVHAATVQHTWRAAIGPAGVFGAATLRTYTNRTASLVTSARNLPGPDLVPRRHLPRLVRGGRNADPPDAGVPDDQLRHGSDDELHDRDPGRPDPDGGRPAHPALGPDQRALREPPVGVLARHPVAQPHLRDRHGKSRVRVDRRQCQRAVHQLPDQPLRAGHQLPRGLASVGAQLPGPLQRLDPGRHRRWGLPPRRTQPRRPAGGEGQDVAGVCPERAPRVLQRATSNGGPDGTGTYARKHEPAISFTNIRTSAGALCQDHELRALRSGRGKLRVHRPEHVQRHARLLGRDRRHLAQGFVPRILTSCRVIPPASSS